MYAVKCDSENIVVLLQQGADVFFKDALDGLHHVTVCLVLTCLHLNAS
jgi:hypothetical protein